MNNPTDMMHPIFDRIITHDEILPSPNTTWDDPLSQQFTGSITREQLDDIFTFALITLNTTSNKRLIAAEIVKLYHIATTSSLIATSDKQ